MAQETRIYKGNGASPGIGIGKVFVLKGEGESCAERHFPRGQEEQKYERYRRARGLASDELGALAAGMRERSLPEAGIFSAQIEMLQDVEVDSGISEAIKKERLEPECAVRRVFGEFAELLGRSVNPLIAERAADLKDIESRLLRILNGGKARALSDLDEAVVVVARGLLPSDTAGMDKSKVLAIVTETGGAASHSAIIARGYGIPAVLGIRDAAAELEDGMTVIVDGGAGCVIARPDRRLLARYIEKRDREARLGELAAKRRGEPLTKDGTRMNIGLNIGSPEDSGGIERSGFVGLFRTEFLYMRKERMPDEEEQFKAYSAVLEKAKGKHVVLRTLDIGGDKTLPYMDLPKEANPFLGKRALRLCLEKREMFATQLRAAYRASVHGELWIMFPMVGSVDDVRSAKLVAEDVKARLAEEGERFSPDVKLGIMIEIPSAALIADILAREVDFASIGSNDLTQYVCAADRMNSGVSDCYQSLAPSVLRLVGAAVSAFNKAGKPISLCGELGGDPMATAVLVGLGLRNLSMGAGSIARVERALSLFTTKEAEDLAKTVLDLPTEKAVKERIAAFMSTREAADE